MVEKYETKITTHRSNVAQGMCVFIIIILLACLSEHISELFMSWDLYPDFLIISDKIDVSDLLIGVFTVQVTMITIALTFTGLLIQLFGSNEIYLGMSLREAVLQRKYWIFSLPTIATVSIFLPVASYYFVAKHYVSALIFVFVVNIVIVAILLKHYLMYAISVPSVHQDIRDIIEKKMLFIVKQENKRKKDVSASLDDIYIDMAEYITALRKSVEHIIDEDDMISFNVFGYYILKVIEKVVNRTAYPSESLMLSGLMRIGDEATFGLLRNKRYTECFAFLGMYHSSYFFRDKSVEHEILPSDYIEQNRIEPFMANIGEACLEMINDGQDDEFSLLDLFGFLTNVQEYFLFFFKVNICSVQIVSTIFEHLFSINENTQSRKKALSETYIDNYFSHISSSFNSSNTEEDDYDKTRILYLYVLELTEIMLYLFDNNNAFVEYILMAETNNQESISMLKTVVTPYLVLNMALIIINDGTQREYIESIKKIQIFHDDDSQGNVVEYSRRLFSSLDICKICHKTLYVSISQGLEGFPMPHMLKYSIDVIIIYIIIFFHDLENYYDIAQWFGHDFLISWQTPDGCFRSIEKELNMYFDNIKVTKYNGFVTSMGLCSSFIDFYDLDEYFFANKEKIMANLYAFNTAIEKVCNNKINSAEEFEELVGHNFEERY